MSASSRQERVNIGQISNEIDSPPAFTAKILQKLVKEELLGSVKGPNGGYYIPKELIPSMNLKEIILAIDGDALFTSCALGLKHCSDRNPCPIHSSYADVRGACETMYSSTLLLDLAKGLKDTTNLKL